MRNAVWFGAWAHKHTECACIIFKQITLQCLTISSWRNEHCHYYFFLFSLLRCGFACALVVHFGSGGLRWQCTNVAQHIAQFRSCSEILIIFFYLSLLAVAVAAAVTLWCWLLNPPQMCGGWWWCSGDDVIAWYAKHAANVYLFDFISYYFGSHHSPLYIILFSTQMWPRMSVGHVNYGRKKNDKKKNMNIIENLHWSLGLSVRACECWWFRPLTETSAWFTARKKKSELREILPLHSLAVLMAMAKVCVPVQVRFGVGDWGPKWRHDFAPPSTHGFYIIIIFNEYNVTCVCVCHKWILNGRL